MFPSTWAVNLLGKSGKRTVQCGYPGLASYIPFQQSAEAMART